MNSVQKERYLKVVRVKQMEILFFVLRPLATIGRADFSSTHDGLPALKRRSQSQLYQLRAHQIPTKGWLQRMKGFSFPHYLYMYTLKN